MVASKRSKRTRGRGLDPAGFPKLRLLGERRCLDFANTVESRLGDRPEECLGRDADLARWRRHAGLLSQAEVGSLLAEANRRPREAVATFERALALRDAAYRAFRAIARGKEPAEADLTRLHDEYVAALARARLGPSNGGYGWVWPDAGVALDRVPWPVARSVVELLTTGDLGRVEECPGASDCGWLFSDTSKNATRRWCSIEGCGSRVKMRRRYA